MTGFGRTRWGELVNITVRALVTADLQYQVEHALLEDAALEAAWRLDGLDRFGGLPELVYALQGVLMHGRSRGLGWSVRAVLDWLLCRRAGLPGFRHTSDEVLRRAGIATSVKRQTLPTMVDQILGRRRG